jgi:hypothetical protein
MAGYRLLGAGFLLSKAQERILPEFGGGRRFPPFKVTEERNAAKELRIAAASADLLVNAALVARGIHHILREDLALIPSGIYIYATPRTRSSSQIVPLMRHTPCTVEGSSDSPICQRGNSSFSSRMTL